MAFVLELPSNLMTGHNNCKLHVGGLRLTRVISRAKPLVC
jgi:hypothetical protein